MLSVYDIFAIMLPLCLSLFTLEAPTTSGEVSHKSILPGHPGLPLAAALAATSAATTQIVNVPRTDDRKRQ